jgi:hypothetical protein
MKGHEKTSGDFDSPRLHQAVFVDIVSEIGFFHALEMAFDHLFDHNQLQKYRFKRSIAVALSTRL